jgi:hypothetical protein
MVEAETAAKRATDSQVLADSEALIAAWNERQAKYISFRTHWCCDCRALLVLVGMLPTVPVDQ